jgi:hypothetical protein
MTKHVPSYAHLDALLADMQDATRPYDIPESPAFQSMIRAAQAEAWDQCAEAAAWCADNGPADAIAPYLAQNRPYVEATDV